MSGAIRVVGIGGSLAAQSASLAALKIALTSVSLCSSANFELRFL